MKRFGQLPLTASGSVLLALGSVAGLGACNGTGGLDCDPSTEDCGPIDVQIDGEGDNESFKSEKAQLCDAGNGTLYAIWVDNRRELQDVWFNKSTDGGASWFEQPVQVKQGGGDATNPSMACNGDRVYVVWEDTRDSQVGYQNIYMNFSNEGGEPDTWRPNDRLIDTFDPDGRQISLGPQVVFRGPNVHVVWFDQDQGAPDIYSASSFNSGGAWEDPIRLSGERLPAADGGGLDPALAGETWSGNPRAAVDDNGVVHVVWEDTIFGAHSNAQAGGAQDILYTRSTDNTAQSWTNWVNVSLTDEDKVGRHFAFKPRIGVSGDNVYIVWADDVNGEDQDTFMRYSATGGVSDGDGARFDGLPIRLDEDDQPGAHDSRNPELVVDGDVAHVVWEDDFSGGYDIHYRRVTAGELGDVIRLDEGDAPGRSNSLEPTIAMGEGAVVVAWLERRVNSEGGFNEIMYNYTDDAANPSFANSDWRLDTVLGGSSYSKDLSIATFTGEVFALWTDYRKGADDPDIRFSHTELGTAVITVDEIQAQAGAAGVQ